MKRILTISLCLILSTSFGQVWIDEDAKWTFDYFNVSEKGTWTFEYTHDTIINGIQSQVIQRTKYRYGGIGNAVIDYGEKYTYNSDDSVFYFHQGYFFLLYDFGAQIGDTWPIAVDTVWGCQDTSVVQVIDTGHTFINGYNYRTITLETITDSFYALNGLCVEKFGIFPTGYEHNNFGFLPGYQNCNGSVLDYDLLTFRCYQDIYFPTYNPTDKDCDTLTSILHFNSEKVNLYPNPATSHITLPNQNYSHQLHTLQGQMILTSSPGDQTISLEGVTPGVYVVTVMDGEEVIGREKLIVR